jgi:asparagine synthase (glutamine-hydrolysing)
MCGIAGADRRALQRGRYDLTKMLGMLQYRGPDDLGEWEGCGWRLGMVRLAIIDPRRGRQPMASADGRWRLVLNGEIYNFSRLRSELESRGRRFTTSSDTEVLLELFVERGVPGALSAVEGMFALAAIDTRTGDLWLARDRFGEKPLYVDRRDGFAFCSELTPLALTANSTPRPSPVGLASILRTGYPWPGVTAIEGIAELGPGTWLRRASTGAEESGIYWRLPDRVDEECGSAARCSAEILSLLDASVRDRLVADVPLGLFLSGGIDSSAIAASAVRERPDIAAVTVGFADAAHDERPLARQTASHLGIELHEENGGGPSFSEAAVDELLHHFGQPFHDTSAIPTRAVSHAARRHFTVVLSGDGGDELFGGYLSHLRADRLRRLGGGRLGGAVSATLASLLPERGRWERAQRALHLNGTFGKGLLPHSMQGLFTDGALLDLFRATPWERPAREQVETMREESRRLWRAVPDPVLAMALQELRVSLPQDILTKVDRMSMAESLEVRAPFLDSRLATYALSIPGRLKISGGLGKRVLREALGGRLPQPVLEAPKRGFTLPVSRWLGQRFWIALFKEVEVYRRDPDAELNRSALTRRVRADAAWCQDHDSYRALHRSFLIYTFLRWRRRILGRGEQLSAA